MPERRELMDRIKGAEREYYAVAHAVARHRPAVRAGDVVLPPATSPRDLGAAADRLEPTYLIRVWAEFETALRSYRRYITGDPEDRIGTENLINWTAGVRQGRAISEDVRDDVHEVREYRNVLVHERDDQEPPPAIAIDVARRRLNIYLQKLPERW
jgi:hypothetical protein